MEKATLKKALESNHPITIMTAGGKSYEVEHQDYVFIAPEDFTTVIVYVKGEPGFSMLDLNTITDVTVHGANA